MSPDEAWDEMGQRFKNGSILNSTRGELEQFLFALASVQVRSEENRQRAQQMGETIRLLLARLDSQESHAEALGVARSALWVALAALGVSGLQAIVAWVTAVQPPF